MDVNVERNDPHDLLELQVETESFDDMQKKWKSIHFGKSVDFLDDSIPPLPPPVVPV